MKSLPHPRLVLALALLCLSAFAFAPALGFGKVEVRAQAPASHLSAEHASVADGQTHACATPVLAMQGYGRALSGLMRSSEVVHVWQLRAERRARFEQAPLRSHRVLLPQFVVCDDVPDDEDVAYLRAEQLRYYPEFTELSVNEAVRSPRLPPLELLERPPRA